MLTRPAPAPNVGAAAEVVEGADEEEVVVEAVEAASVAAAADVVSKKIQFECFLKLGSKSQPNCKSTGRLAFFY
jgi:hypothetical protein